MEFLEFGEMNHVSNNSCVLIGTYVQSKYLFSSFILHVVEKYV